MVPTADRLQTECIRLRRKTKLLTSLNEAYKTRARFKNRRIFNPPQKSHEEMKGTTGNYL